MQKRLVISGLPPCWRRRSCWLKRPATTSTRAANFAGFKTYAHKDGTKVGQELIDARILAAIDAQMAAKGFTVSESSPDVFVVYHVAFDKQQDISTYSTGYAGGYGRYGWGYGGGWGGGSSTTQVRDILIGTLVIDWPTPRAASSCGAGWESRKSTRKPSPRSATRASTTP